MGPANAGARLKAGEVGGQPAWFLGRSQLLPGDAVELFTNSANGWVRGEFVWTGSMDDRPEFRIPLWDPRGELDAEGLPPRVGEIRTPIPAKAVLRWPR